MNTHLTMLYKNSHWFFQVLLNVICNFQLLVLVRGRQPDFLFPLENVTVVQGRDAIFTCVVNKLGGHGVDTSSGDTHVNTGGSIVFPTDSSAMKVAWIKADTKAVLAIHEHVITNNARLSVTNNDDNTWTLNIRNVRREDKGYYMCQVNTDPMTMQMAYLEVVIPPDISSEETSGDMMVPEGGFAKLVCKANGYPAPKITWRREDSKEIIIRSNPPSKQRVFSVESEILNLTKVTRSEMGAYQCIAANGVPPTVSKRLMLHVHFHPLIQVPNQLVGAPYGTNVTLQCHVEASPKAINYWSRESGSSEMIIASNKYSMSEWSNVYYSVYMKLTICNLSKADLGGYKCVSKNSLGEAEGSIRIYEVDLSKRQGRQRLPDKDGSKNRILSEIEFEIEGVGGSGLDKNGSSLYIDILENRASESRITMSVMCLLLIALWRWLV